MTLSAEQNEALDGLLSLAKTKPVVTLGGYAGTGKTTLIKELIQQLPRPKIAAFTGKAADVLRRKGIDASTIHSLIYEIQLDPMTGKPMKSASGGPIWVRKKNIQADSIVIDESSMLTEELYNDLLSYGKPMYVIGDHGQLPPVGDDFNIMESPDITLETIHRNAGEIARFAEHLREGNPASSFSPENDQVVIGDFDVLKTKPDQAICGFNKSRHNLNEAIRHSLGFSGRIREKERVMVLANNKECQVFNGMQGIVTSVTAKSLTFDVDGSLRTMPVYHKNPESKKNARWQVPYSFGYAATCHKCQGSEYPVVHVFEEQCPYWEAHRWSYTAASRAQERIIWS